MESVIVRKDDLKEPEIKVDIGCGTRKREGYIGVDQIAFDGVDHVYDLGKAVWPFKDDSVDAAHCCHCYEHIPRLDRFHFMNELWRVLKVGAKCELIVPHWSTGRAYGDLTHEWPPISEFHFFYWKRTWRLDEGNAPHNDIKYNAAGYKCNFETTWGYALNPILAARSQGYQEDAVNFKREAVWDIIATLIKAE